MSKLDKARDDLLMATAVAARVGAEHDRSYLEADELDMALAIFKAARENIR